MENHVVIVELDQSVKGSCKIGQSQMGHAVENGVKQLGAQSFLLKTKSS